MKTLVACLLIVSGILSGCVAVPAYRSDYRDGYSQRDRDRDGVANRYDRDRDGDGVRNNRDHFPNNPWRY